MLDQETMEYIDNRIEEKTAPLYQRIDFLEKEVITLCDKLSSICKETIGDIETPFPR